MTGTLMLSRLVRGDVMKDLVFSEHILQVSERAKSRVALSCEYVCNCSTVVRESTKLIRVGDYLDCRVG